MNLILLGAPGAGKGTQAELLTEKLTIPAISTGNMLREAIANGSALGQKVKKFMDEGSLVPDDVILDIVAERVSRADCANGFILDGVPRTLAQAEALDARSVSIDHVISIEIDDELIEGRMTGRRVCGNVIPGSGSLAIGGTSVIIVIGVALETVKAIEAQMLMRHYKGVLD